MIDTSELVAVSFVRVCLFNSYHPLQELPVDRCVQQGLLLHIRPYYASRIQKFSVKFIEEIFQGPPSLLHRVNPYEGLSLSVRVIERFIHGLNKVIPVYGGVEFLLGC